jgi:hypothetical protein
MEIINKNYKFPWVGKVWDCLTCNCIFKTEKDEDGEFYTTVGNLRGWRVKCPKCGNDSINGLVKPTSEKCVKDGHDRGRGIFGFKIYNGTCLNCDYFN